jgi:hypothetical protein
VTTDSTMNTYAAFGVGLGNLGRQSRVRIAKAQWVADLNRGLAALRTDALIVAAYGHTGNFIVTSTLDPDALRSCSGSFCAPTPRSLPSPPCGSGWHNSTRHRPSEARRAPGGHRERR